MLAPAPEMSPAPLPVLPTHWASQLLQDEGAGGGGGGLGGVYLSLLCCFLPRPGCPADTPIYVKSQWLPQPGQPPLEPTPPHPSVPEGTTPSLSSGPPATTALFPGRVPGPWDLATFCASPLFTRGSCRMGGTLSVCLRCPAACQTSAGQRGRR